MTAIMETSVTEVHGYAGEKFPLLGIDRTRDALAAYCAARWPVGRRKSVSREWGLSDEQARSVCEGSASQATLDRIWRHKNGGWDVLLPVFGALLDQTVDQYLARRAREITELGRHNEQRAQKLAALGGNLLPWRGRSDPLDSELPPEPNVRRHPRRN